LNGFFGCERQFRWLVVSRAVSMSHCKGMTLSKNDFDKGIPLFTDKAILYLSGWLSKEVQAIRQNRLKTDHIKVSFILYGDIHTSPLI
jgi:hypothetical protein